MLFQIPEEVAARFPRLYDTYAEESEDLQENWTEVLGLSCFLCMER